MSEKEIAVLSINMDFYRFEVPLNDRERKLLEDNIRNNGYDKPFIVWNGVLLKDFDAYIICHNTNTPFYIKRIGYPNKLIATSELIKTQMREQAPIPDGLRKYMIGKRFIVEKALGKIKSEKTPKCRNSYVPKYQYDSSAMATRERLAREFYISHQTVYKYSVLAEALDKIALKSQELFDRIITDDIKISIDTVEKIANLPSSEIDSAIQKMLKDKDTHKYTKARKELADLEMNKKIHIVRGHSFAASSIKDLPKYDPDSDLKSLIYTVPSWIGSIQRISKVSDLSAVTLGTKQNARRELYALMNILTDFLFKLEESEHE